MIRLPRLVLAGIGSALLLASAASGASAETRHGTMPSRQMYMHHHRPMMHRYMMHRRMMHRGMMRHHTM